jgi:aspartate/methionine/tyrosine aminotransferase
MADLASTIDDPVQLAGGDPNFTTPEHIIAGAAERSAAGSTGYAPGEGFLELREAIVDKLRRVNAVTASPDEVCVTTGACGGLFTSIMLAVEPGADVLVPDPGWANYAAMIHVLGARTVPYPVDASTGWRLDPAAVEAAVTPETAALILNSPGNPTGVVLDPADLVAVAELAAERGIAVISDEAYDQVVFDREPFSVASQVNSDQLLTVYSFSKTYAMTGWRIGYAVGPAGFVRELSLLQEPVVSSAATISMHGATVALQGPQDCVTEMVSAYAERCRQAMALLDSEEIDYVKPGGSFFIMVDIRSSGLDSWAFATRLAERHRVVVVPGLAFGEGGEGFVRVSLASASATILEGLSRIVETLHDLKGRAPAAV